MADGKKSFILYQDQRGIFDKLTNDQAGKLIKHIFSYCSDESPEGDFVTELAFESIKQQLKRDLKKYEIAKDLKSENGKIGNLKRWHPSIYKDYLNGLLTIDQAIDKSIATRSVAIGSDRVGSQDIANIAVNVTVNDNVNDNVKEKESKKKKTLEERKLDFKKRVLLFQKDFETSLLKNFFEYWTEHNDNGTVMKFEKQKTFNTKLRLKTWAKNEKNYTKVTPGDAQPVKIKMNNQNLDNLYTNGR